MPAFSLLTERAAPLAQRSLRNTLLAAGIALTGASAAFSASPATFDLNSILDGLTALKYWEEGRDLRVTQYKVSSGFQFCDLSLSNGKYTDGYVTIGVANTTPPQALVVYTDAPLTSRPAGSLKLAMQVDNNVPFVVTLAHQAAQYATAWVNGPPTDFEPLEHFQAFWNHRAFRNGVDL